MSATRTHRSALEPLAVAGLTLLAFAIRVAGIDQSLFGDELFTLAVVENGPSGVMEGLKRYEVNPPLYYYLAALAGQLGEVTVLARVPSLLFGTAAVPLVYVLGRLTLGRAAGLVAAALLTISPFALFYAVEARAYSGAMCLILISAITLILAVRSGRTVWWMAFWAASAAALYTHYTAVFALAAAGVWAAAAHRDKWRPLTLSFVGLALAFLPWLPTFIDQNETPVIPTGLSSEEVGQAVVRVFAGHPLRLLPLGAFPGRGWMILLGLAGAAALAVALAVRLAGRPRPGATWNDSPFLLVVVLALAAPLGVLAFSVVNDQGGQLYTRYFIVSLPSILLLIGALLAWLPRLPALALGGIVGLVFGVCTIRMLDVEWQRPDTRAAAQLIDARAGPSDPVIEISSYLLFATISVNPDAILAQPTPLDRDLDAYLRRSRRRFGVVHFEPVAGAIRAVADPRAWMEGSERGHLVLAGIEGSGKFQTPTTLQPPRPPRRSNLRLVATRRFAGLIPVVVRSYATNRPR